MQVPTSSNQSLHPACAFCHKDASKKCTGCFAVGVCVHYCSTKCQRSDWRVHRRICGKDRTVPIPSLSSLNFSRLDVARDIGADLVWALLDEDLAKVTKVIAELNGLSMSTSATQAQFRQAQLRQNMPQAWSDPAMHPLIIICSTTPTCMPDPVSGKTIFMKQISESFRLQVLPMLLRVPLILDAINNEHSMVRGCMAASILCGSFIFYRPTTASNAPLLPPPPPPLHIPRAP